MRHQQTPGRGRCAQLTAALVCLLGLGNVVTSQGLATWDPMKSLRNACSTNLAQVMVLGNKLYLDGGELFDEQEFKNGKDKPYRPSDMLRWQNKDLWELDLSKKFNVSIPPWTAHAKPTDWNQYYNARSGTIWNIEDGKFYTVGGRISGWEGPQPGHKITEPYYKHNTSGYYFQLPQPRIFAYDPQAGNWSSELLPNNVRRVVENAYTQSARNRVGYSFGGFLVPEHDFSTEDFYAKDSEGEALDKLSVYNFDTKKFNFTSMPVDIGKTRQVLMHSLDRVGSEGTLIAFAGTNLDTGEKFRPMEEILIYDIGSSTWMKQKATGDIPPPRIRTCSKLVPAPDLSSFQIYLFSGETEGGVQILDMYVLSIPAFTWTQIEMKGYPNEWPIANMACGLYEERQFIIVPGDVNVTTAAVDGETYWVQCNQGNKVHVFDTYDWEFNSEFDPDNKGSRVPPQIFAQVGGSDTGGATLQQPAAGWDYQALGDIFSIRNELPPAKETQIPSTGSNTTSPATSQETQETAKSNKTNKTAIIGGAVGGACAVALAIGILIFFIKKKKFSQLESSTTELDGAIYRHELQGANSQGAYELYTHQSQEMGVNGGIPAHGGNFK